MNEEKYPSSDEKIMAGLANGAVIIPMWGLIVAVLIWLLQREKSEFVRQQGMQAIAWQVVQIGVMFGGMALYMGSFFLMMGGMFAADTAGAEPPFFFFFPFMTMGCIFLLQIVFIIVGLWGGVRSFQGHAFTYPVIGNRVRGYLNQKPGAVQA